VPEPLGHGRLAVRTGHGDEPVRRQPPAELELADDLLARLPSRRDHRSVPGHPGTLDHGLHALEQSDSVAIEIEFDAGPGKPAGIRRSSAVGAVHARADGEERLRRGDAGPRQPDDQERAVGKRRSRNR
jgi:hypothetical protein